MRSLALFLALNVGFASIAFAAEQSGTATPTLQDAGEPEPMLDPAPIWDQPVPSRHTAVDYVETWYCREAKVAEANLSACVNSFKDCVKSVAEAVEGKGDAGTNAVFNICAEQIGTQP